MQGFQHLRDTGIGLVFVQHSHRKIAHTVQPDGLGGKVRRYTEAHKGFMQGRAHKNPHFLPGWNGNTQLLQGVGSTVHNTFTGIGEGTIQVK